MASVAENFRERAERLLALSVIARDSGRANYAESLTKIAAQCLDHALTLEQIAKPHGQHHRPAQQQQQPQSDDSEKKE
jgi:hypothetical protein